MKGNDKTLLVVVLVVALLSVGVVALLERLLVDEDARAVVYHGNTPVLSIALADGSYTVYDEALLVHPDDYPDIDAAAACFVATNVYCVRGDNGPVVIEHQAGRVSVVYEISPLNLCRTHGPTNTPARPITCLPNRIMIRVETPDDVLDGYLQRSVPWILSLRP